MMSADDIQATNLAYYSERQAGRQWRVLIQTFVDEMFHSAGRADACEFLRHVGKRMAQSMPLGEQPTLSSLQAAMNQVWLDMDWGWVRLHSDGRSVEILHGAYPQAQVGGETWREALAAVLEGIYQQWFVAQGEAALRVRCESRQSDALVLRCSA